MMATTTLSKTAALAKARTAARLLADAKDRHELAIQTAATVASRSEIAEAVGLSKNRVQQIIHGVNR